MKAYQEITHWNVEYRQPNHQYLLDGDRVIAYRRWGEGPPEFSKTPRRIDRRGRKFIEIDSSVFGDVKETKDDTKIKVQGSKGNTYEVDIENKTCTCPGFTFRGNCRHVKENIKET